MADFCSKCTLFKDQFDIDLYKIALNLERGHSESFICEGCNIRAIYKDETGRLYLGKDVEGSINMDETTIEALMI